MGAIVNVRDNLLLARFTDGWQSVRKEDNNERARGIGLAEFQGLTQCFINRSAILRFQTGDEGLGFFDVFFRGLPKLAEEGFSFSRESQDFKTVLLVEISNAEEESITRLLDLLAGHRAGGI